MGHERTKELKGYSFIMQNENFPAVPGLSKALF